MEPVGSVTSGIAPQAAERVDPAHFELLGIDPSSVSGGAPFSAALSDAMDSLVQQSRNADTMVNDLAAGRHDDVIATMMAMNKASLSMTLALEVRNRVLDAYHDVMRMSV